MHHPSIHARTTPGKVAYRMATSGQAITYRELDERSNQGAHLFRSLGLRAGDHMAIVMENCLAFLEICWAAQRSGLYYTAVSRHLTAGEIAYIVGDCGARVVVTTAACADRLRPLARERSDIVFFAAGAPVESLRSWDAEVGTQPTTPIADETTGRDMLYSSGTTGRPKGVKGVFQPVPIEVANPALLALCRDLCGMNAGGTYLSPAPLYHAAPLRFSMMMGALGGTTIVMERFDPEDYLRCVDHYRATHTQLVPTMFVRILKLSDDVRRRYSVATLESAIHAAAPCPVEVKARMIDWWGPILIEYYGGTEGNGITIVTAQEWLAHRGSVGRAVVGKLKIVDDATDDEVPAGVVGSVYFADGPQFAYHNDPEKTKRAFNSHGWSTLGDVGYVDSDGYLYLTDRKAYVIISGGVNIYPQETEDVLIDHPAVADVAVFGVPNEEMGEEVKAVVEPRDMALAGSELEAELIAYCRARLSPLKCPRSIDFDAALPRTPTGKLVKRHLRDRYLAAARSPSAPTMSTAP